MKNTPGSIFVAGLLFACAGCGAGGAHGAGSQDAVGQAGGTPPAVYHKISPQEAKEMIDANPGAIVLDVRTDGEFQMGHIHGARSLPLDQIDSKASTALPDKNALILVYCQGGTRSKAAANKLVAMGYTRVYDFGGIISWPYGVE